jgi:hypothetical protein
MKTPTPAAAISTPTPDSSRPISSSATTVVSVSQRPRTNERTPHTAITRATRESIPRRRRPGGPAAFAPGSALSPRRRLATGTSTPPATATATAADRSVAAAPSAAITTPPASAPSTRAAPLTLLSRAAAAVSSEGVRTSAGRRVSRHVSRGFPVGAARGSRRHSDPARAASRPPSEVMRFRYAARRFGSSWELSSPAIGVGAAIVAARYWAKAARSRSDSDGVASKALIPSARIRSVTTRRSV